LTQEEAFLKCKKEGKIIAVSGIDIEKVKTTLAIAESDIASGKLLVGQISKESSQWNSVFKLFYDALHELADSFLRFEEVKFDNHQCLFAYLCEKHPELVFSWDILEKIRTKRNGINYYGSPIRYEDWKEVEVPFKLYLNKLKEEVRKKIAESEKQF